MLKLNSNQEGRAGKALIIELIQIRREPVTLVNKRYKGIIIRSILNYEMFGFC